MEQVSVYNNERRYIFSNWTKEDFVGRWENSHTTIKSGETKELPMYLAYNWCKHLVDREMQRDGKASLMAVEEERKSYENKTIAEITAGTDSPALATLKEQIRKEIESEVKEIVNEPLKAATEIKVGEFKTLEEEVKDVKPSKPSKVTKEDKK